MGVTNMNLLPPCGHEETNEHDAKAHSDVPGANRGNRPAGSGDVIGQNPGQTKEHQPKHNRLEPDRVVVALLVGATCARGVF